MVDIVIVNRSYKATNTGTTTSNVACRSQDTQVAHQIYLSGFSLAKHCPETRHSHVAKGSRSVKIHNWLGC